MNDESKQIKKYATTCSEPDCFKIVKEDDIERNASGEIYERSKKCWDCRTKKDKVAIKKWRKEHKKR